jgi:hypothetical protein
MIGLDLLMICFRSFFSKAWAILPQLQWISPMC